MAVGTNIFNTQEGSTVILNPGSFRNNRLSFITLTEEDGHWNVELQEFINQ